MTSRKPQALLIALVLVFLLITASRMIYLSTLEMNYDEVWSIWQTFGSPLDVLRWTPSDWPPLYFLGLYGWRLLAGIDPFVLRYFSVLGFLAGAACMYRAGRRMWDDRAGILAALTYGALGLNLFLSMVVRSYALMLALTPLALWLAIRYFTRPSVRRAVPLALCLDVLFYLHFTSVFVFLLLGLYTLLVYCRAIWHWWLPGLMAAPLIALEFIPKLGIAGTRTGANALLPLPPLPEALAQTYWVYTGPSFWLWAALFLLAAFILLRQRRGQPSAIALLLWFISPVGIYLFQSHLGLFQDIRYMWWVTPGIGLWIAWGASRLPRLGRGLVAGALAVIMFWGGIPQSYQSSLYRYHAAFSMDFRELKQRFQPGDVVVVDPKLDTPNEIWDYYMRLYFPTGLPFVADPQNARRVWYFALDYLQDPVVSKAVFTGRTPGVYFGPPDFFLRLYEAPPDRQGIPFKNGLRFHGVDIDGLSTPRGVVFHTGETIRLRLWWSIDQPISLDYSIGLYLATPKAVAQVDGPPQIKDGPSQTSQWVLNRYYLDERELTLPASTPEGQYPITLTVYQWWDSVRISAPGVDSNNLLPIQSILVHTWSS